MRITQNMMKRSYLRRMSSNLKRYNETMERMTGPKYTKASDNLSDTSRALRVRQTITDNNQYLVNIRDANGRLSAAENNLMSVNDILVTAQEQLLTKALNDPNATSRHVVAKELDGMREEMIQFLNSKFSTAFLFGGTENGKAPFDIGEDGFLTYNGVPVDDIYEDPADGKLYHDAEDPANPGAAPVKTPVPESEPAYIDVGLGLIVTQDQVESHSAFQITFSGARILGFGETDDGETKNLYNMLKKASDALRTEPFDRELVSKFSDSIKANTETMMFTVTDIGAKTNFLDKTVERIENDNHNLTLLQQKLEVSDTAEEAMNWKMYSAVMMATYQFGAQVLPMSLMDFIK